MTAPQEGRAEMAARISEMASTVYGVPDDEFTLKTADDCVRMLEILSRIALESTTEPFLPPLDKTWADESMK